MPYEDDIAVRLRLGVVISDSVDGQLVVWADVAEILRPRETIIRRSLKRAGVMVLD